VALPQEGRRRRIKQDQKPVVTETGTATDIAAKLRADADDPDEVRKALDDAAGMSRNLWLAYLTFGTYLAISVASVTHTDLFLQTPIKLPLLNVELPLVAFFWVAPLLFLIFHAYLLLNLRLLVDNVLRFNQMLEGAKLTPEEQDSFRLLLSNFPFVQLLAGTRDSKKGPVGWVLAVIVWITIVFAPVVLLVVIQLKFLPYHHELVTWLHRGVIAADILLLWFFWGSIMRAANRGRLRSILALTGNLTLTIVVLLFATLIATFPGEWLVDENGLATTRIFGTKSAYELLFSGEVNELKGTRDSVWDNTLVLPDKDFVEDARLDKVDTTISLRGRDLRGAVLIRNDLRKADFTGANLDDAQLTGSRLDQAKFGCAKRGQRVIENEATCGASLQGAQLNWARLRAANFNNTNLRGANLEGAQLQIASLEDARLQGAYLKRAQLLGASLKAAQLQAAFLDLAHLQGALLDDANLESASLFQTVVWHASHPKAKPLESANRACLVSRQAYLDYPTKTEMRLDKEAAAKLIKEASADASKALSKQLQARLGSLLDKRSAIFFGTDADDAFWKSQASEAGPAGDQYGDGLASVVCAPNVSVSVLRGVILSKRLATMESRTQLKFLRLDTCPPVAHLYDLDRDALSPKTQESSQSKCYDRDEPKGTTSASTP
jgi:hypothetical protein